MTIEDVGSNELSQALKFWAQYHESVEVHTASGHIRLTKEQIVAELMRRGLMRIR